MTKEKKEFKAMTDNLRQRSPEEWLKLIQKTPKEIRAHMARLVWWDWFSGRPVNDRWHHLDDFINIPYAQLMWERENPDKVVQPDANEVFQLLVSYGYPESMALNRA